MPYQVSKADWESRNKKYEDDLAAWKASQPNSTPQRQDPNIGPALEEYLKNPSLSQNEKDSVTNWLNASPSDRQRNPGNYKIPGYYDQENPTWLSQNLSPENPLPWQKYLPSDVRDIADAQFARDANYYKKGIIGNSLDPSSMFSPKQTPMSQAIENKYKKMADTKISGLLQETGNKATALESRAQQSASDIYGKQMQIIMNNFKEQYEFQRQRKEAQDRYKAMQAQAESQFFSAVFGWIPFVGGAMAAGAASAPGNNSMS